jgi:hypothetical protein
MGEKTKAASQEWASMSSAEKQTYKLVAIIHLKLSQPGQIFGRFVISSDAAAVQNGAEQGAEQKLKYAKSELKKVVKHVSVSNVLLLLV